MSENSISSQQNQEEIDEYLENIKYVADKLKKYYAYKSAYESEIKDKKRQIRTRYPNKDERRQKLRAYVPNCISCKRAVSSIFSKERRGGTYHLIGKCGNTNEPCSLNIDISLGKPTSLIKEKEQQEAKMQELIKQIITIKMTNYLDTYLKSR